MRCIDVREGVERVDHRVNWTGVINGISFLVGVFFGSAGIVGLVDRRRAAIITGASVLTCFAMVLIFFA